MIENVKIIHEYQEEMIVTLPAQFTEISLVTHKLLHIKDGSPVKVQE